MKYKNFFYPVSFALYFISLTCYAEPFIITPQGSLPTSVDEGSSVNATYTVTNNTLQPREYNFVKWYPPHVQQVTDAADPTVCSERFSLGAKNSVNQSCTLKLKISGPVNKNDPNWHHHLFICFPDGKTCAGPTPANSLNVKQTTTSATTLSTAVGFYQPAAVASISPLAYISSDNGATWSFSLPPTTGLTGSPSILTGVACQGTLCSAVGSAIQSADGKNQQPISYSSTDRGVNWSEPYLLSVTGLGLSTSYELFAPAISCSGSNCSIVGSYQNNGGNHVPFSYFSSNNGETWSLPDLISTTGLPIPNKGAALGGVSCTGTTCNAVGFYIDVSSFRHPLIYHSTDGGDTWPTLITPSSAGIPATADAKLMAITCSGDICTALGVYTDASLNNTPFTYLSSDGGATWLTKANLLSIANLPTGNKGATLNSIACVGVNCVAVGSYKDDTAAAKTYAVYYTSADSGVTWADPEEPPTTTASTSIAGLPSVLYSVSCINTICSAVGRYQSAAASPFPLTYQSIDNGVHWTLFLPDISSIPANWAMALGVGGTQSGFLQT